MSCVSTITWVTRQRRTSRLRSIGPSSSFATIRTLGLVSGKARDPGSFGWIGPGAESGWPPSTRPVQGPWDLRVMERASHLEALARLQPDSRDETVVDAFRLDESSIALKTDWQAPIAAVGVTRLLASGRMDRAASIAGAVQNQIGDLLIELVTDVRRRNCHSRMPGWESFLQHPLLHAGEDGRSL